MQNNERNNWEYKPETQLHKSKILNCYTIYFNKKLLNFWLHLPEAIIKTK